MTAVLAGSTLTSNTTKPPETIRGVDPSQSFENFEHEEAADACAKYINPTSISSPNPTFVSENPLHAGPESSASIKTQHLAPEVQPLQGNFQTSGEMTLTASTLTDPDRATRILESIQETPNQKGEIATEELTGLAVGAMVKEGAGIVTRTAAQGFLNIGKDIISAITETGNMLVISSPKKKEPESPPTLEQMMTRNHIPAARRTEEQVLAIRDARSEQDFRRVGGDEIADMSKELANIKLRLQAGVNRNFTAKDAVDLRAVLKAEKEAAERAKTIQPPKGPTASGNDNFNLNMQEGNSPIGSNANAGQG